MAQITYMEAVKLVNDYYGNPDILHNMFYYQYTPEQMSTIFQQVPGLNMTMSKSGKILGYDYDMSLAKPVATAPYIDSNAIPPTYGVESGHALVPANTTIDGNFVDVTSGAKKVATQTTLATVADKVTVGLLGASIGTKLGVLVSRTLYASDPQWWDTHLPTMNPETWDDCCGENEALKTVVRAVFGLENDDTTMYMDERLMAYVYATLLANGFYDGSATVVDKDIEVGGYVSHNDILIATTMSEAFEMLGLPFVPQSYDQQALSDYENAGCYYLPVAMNTSADKKAVIAILPTSGVLTFNNSISLKEADNSYKFTTKISNVNQYSPGRYWYFDVNSGKTRWGGAGFTDFEYVYNYSDVSGATSRGLIAGTVTETSGIEGMENDERASIHIVPSEVINPTTGVAVTPSDDMDDILQALKNKYPDLFNDSIYEDVVQPDGTVQRLTYVPVPTPDDSVTDEPVTGYSYQGHEAVDPETSPQSLLDQLTEILVSFGDPPTTGSGNTPAVIPPTGTASSLWKIYNPTEAELNSFASWLWTDNLIEQFKKLFNSPMDAVIGVHKVFASPSVGGRANIKCGYLDSGVSSNYINSQYTSIDCGTVSLREYFGNVFDYSPYTEISLFLPFIGIVRLDNADVMRADISIKYSVDVLTGACLAEVKVMRDGAGGNLYVYSGSAIVQYPLTSGSYAGAIAGVLSIAGGLIGTVVSGGSMIPATVGVINGVSRLRADVQKSGGFSGCSGAMGGKIPYIIVSRPQLAMAENFQHFTGLPANSMVTLSACSGRTRVKAIHVEEINKATNEEKIMIERLLKDGVTI